MTFDSGIIESNVNNNLGQECPGYVAIIRQHNTSGVTRDIHH